MDGTFSIGRPLRNYHDKIKSLLNKGQVKSTLHGRSRMSIYLRWIFLDRCNHRWFLLAERFKVEFLRESGDVLP